MSAWPRLLACVLLASLAAAIVLAFRWPPSTAALPLEPAVAPHGTESPETLGGGAAPRGECPSATETAALEAELARLGQVPTPKSPFEEAPSAIRPAAVELATDALVQAGHLNITTNCKEYPCLVVSEYTGDGMLDSLVADLAKALGDDAALSPVRIGVATPDGEKREIVGVAALPAGTEADATMRRGIQRRLLAEI